ncbi:MAG: hypothetical protein RL173_1635 [Fibrobacterota bacterium]|jgi:hypothetical protein
MIRLSGRFLSIVSVATLLCAPNPVLAAAKPESRKDAPAKSTKATKSVAIAKPAPATAAKPVAGGKIEELDKLCRRDLSWGKLDAVKRRCAELEPRESPSAIFWRLTLSDDPNDLRKGYAPAGLAKGEVDSRLLLSAGRYHFARGQIREMEDLVEIARKKKISGTEIDTLKHLAAGK